MRYNPQIHQRKSIRLKGYDYTQAGLYFITICCQNRAHLFGKIRRGEPPCSPDLSPNERSPDVLPNERSPDLSPNERSPDNTPDNNAQMILNDAGKMVEKWYYELENKFHDIKCHEMVVMPNHFHCIIENVGTTISAGADLRACPGINDDPDNNILGEHTGSPLHRVVQWFKTMTTNHYIRGVKQNNWERFNGKIWQRNYWEHIIRTENDYQRIAQYIMNNPQNWNNDKLQ